MLSCFATIGKGKNKLGVDDVVGEGDDVSTLTGLEYSTSTHANLDAFIQENGEDKGGDGSGSEQEEEPELEDQDEDNESEDNDYEDNYFDGGEDDGGDGGDALGGGGDEGKTFLLIFDT